MIKSKGGECTADTAGPDQDGSKCADLDNL